MWTPKNVSPNGGVVSHQTSDSEICFLSKPAQQWKGGKPQRRSAEACRAGNSYEREQFQPGPKRMYLKLFTELYLLPNCPVYAEECLFRSVLVTLIFSSAHTLRRFGGGEEEATEYHGERKK